TSGMRSPTEIAIDPPGIAFATRTSRIMPQPANAGPNAAPPPAAGIPAVGGSVRRASEHAPTERATLQPAVAGGVIDHQGQHRTDDRPDDARRLQCPLVEILVEEQVAEEATDERSDHAEPQRPGEHARDAR